MAEGYKTGPVGLTDILYRSGGDLAGWSGEELVHDEEIIALSNGIAS